MADGAKDDATGDDASARMRTPLLALITAEALERDYQLVAQRRLASGGLSTHTAGPFATAPYWVRLTRSGATITASVSTDGSTWTVVGSDQFAIGATVYIGLAVTSHDATQLATGVVSNVTVQ